MPGNIRNFAANNHYDIDHRNDRGNLFENFFLLELLCNDKLFRNKINFWRATNQQQMKRLIGRQ